MTKIFVFAENTSTLLKICFGTHKLGDRIEAVVIDEIGAGFADKIWIIPFKYGADLVDYTESIAALIKKEKPNTFLMESTKNCMLIAERLATLLGSRVSIESLNIEHERVLKHFVDRSKEEQIKKKDTVTTILMVSDRAFQEAELEKRNGEVETIKFIVPAVELSS